VIWVLVFGYTRFRQLTLRLRFSAVCLFVAVFNLLPVQPLDSATAWGIVPALIEQARRKDSTEVV
jgi:Zn-dependent protease